MNGTFTASRSAYYIDSLTALMLIVVSFVCTLVVIYSLGYMHEEGDEETPLLRRSSPCSSAVMLGLVMA